MNAGGAQFGSTSFTFLVRRIFAALVFGAQLCSARAGSEDNATDAQASSAIGQPTKGAVESNGAAAGKDHARAARAMPSSASTASA